MERALSSQGPLPTSERSDAELAGTAPHFVADRSAFMGSDDDLFAPSVQQRREKVVRLFEELAPLVASLSEELCKEDHGQFMRLASQIERAAIIIEANLSEIEVSAQEDEPAPRPNGLTRLVALFWARAAQVVEAYARMSRRRDRQNEALRRLRGQLAELRGRPTRIHAAAVEHVRRLILYDDSRVKDLQQLLANNAEALAHESRKNPYSDRASGLKEAAKLLKEQMPHLEAEAADRALQRIQESDNGQRQK